MNFKNIERTAAYRAYHDPILKRCSELKRYLTGAEKKNIIKLYEYLKACVLRGEPINYDVIFKELVIDSGWRRQEYLARKDKIMAEIEKMRESGVPVEAEFSGKVSLARGMVIIEDEVGRTLRSDSSKLTGKEYVILMKDKKYLDNLDKHYKQYQVIEGLENVYDGQEVKKGDMLGLASKT